MIVRVTDSIPEMKNELSLLTHPDLRNTARIKTFTDFMSTSLSSDRIYWKAAARSHNCTLHGWSSLPPSPILNRLRDT